MAENDTEGFAYEFERAELTMNDKTYVAISNVSISQPTTRGATFGTRPFPIRQGKGRMDHGTGSIEWSDIGERNQFIADLGEAWREKEFTVTWVLTAEGKPPQKKAAFGCMLTDEPDDHEGGSEGLGGGTEFTFMRHTINGKAPHAGMPTPTR